MTRNQHDPGTRTTWLDDDGDPTSPDGAYARLERHVDTHDSITHTCYTVLRRSTRV
jgi:hypothetical protein